MINPQRRIKEIRRQNLETLTRIGNKQRGLHAKDIAAKIGIAETMFSALRSGRKNIGDALAARIERQLGLSEGSLDSDMISVAEELETPSTATNSLYARVPFFSENTDIEQWISGSDILDTATTYLCPIPHNKRTFVTTVMDPAMAPTFRIGEWVFVDPECDWKEDRAVYVLLLIGSRRTIRKAFADGIGGHVYTPANEAWPTWTEPPGPVGGRVIFHGQPL